MSRGCGSCNFCCEMIHVPDIGKPAHMTCWWTTVHGGCMRQSEKPKPTNVVYNEEAKSFSLANNDPGDINLAACAQFRCLWLDSQNHTDPLLQQPRTMRPDQTRVMLGPQDQEDERLLYVHVDPNHPDAWRQEPIASYLRDLINRGGRLEIYIGDVKVSISEPF